VSDESKSTEEPSSAAKADAETPAGDADAHKDERKDEHRADRKADRKEAKRADRKQSRKDAGAKVKAGSDAVRNRIASVVWLIALVCALFLAVGALLIALKANETNTVVQFILEGADRLDGPFSRQDGIFTFDGANAAIKNALVNWGIAAVAYLIVGKILDRVIRP